MTRAKARPIRADEVVHVDTDARVNWKVLAVAGDLAHLSKMAADPRLDWREVPVGRLTRAGEPQSQGSGS